MPPEDIEKVRQALKNGLEKKIKESPWENEAKQILRGMVWITLGRTYSEVWAENITSTLLEELRPAPVEEQLPEESSPEESDALEGGHVIDASERFAG